ncbi:MmgE/PrpD family protein [Sinorhizobium meliloti]|nr:MmgE/PrpD family protein [Sinorhizobium meliloti]
MTTTSEPHGLTAQVAEYSRKARFEDMPDAAVDAAKRCILDTLGCMVLGSTIDSAQIMAGYVRSIEGIGQSTVIGAGFKAPAAFAALTNGTASHADEMDASHISWGHPASIAIGVGLSLSEAQGLGGKDFINAATLMHDVGARLMDAAGGRQAMLETNHTHSSVPFAIGAAAAAGNLLGLDQMQMQYALAIASMKIFAPAAFMDERNHMTKAMTHGQSAYAGTTAALLASRGFEANERIYEAKHGLMDFWANKKSDPSRVTAKLGEYFSITDTGFKYYSAGYPIHAPLHGALQILRDNSLSPDNVESVTLGMGSHSADIVDNRDNASISVQAMVSLGMVLGRLGYDQAHDEEALKRLDVQRLRSLITIFRDPEMDARSATTRAAWVEIKTKDGQVYRAPEQLPPGHWERGGMPWSDVEAKFAMLVEPRLGIETSEKIIALGRRLEELRDLSELGRLLSGPSKAPLHHSPH